MPVQMAPFWSEGTFLTFNPVVTNRQAVQMFTIECHNCGFEPADRPPHRCPKCQGASWIHIPRPSSLLENESSTTLKINYYRCSEKPKKNRQQR